MKGDGNIKILKFIGTGYNNNYQAKIKIYNNNKKIFEGITYNGIIKVDLEENKIYKIEAYFLNEKICTNIYVTKECKYTFIFTSALINNTRTITISLVDLYYNLPIERGEIFLWQKQ